MGDFHNDGSGLHTKDAKCALLPAVAGSTADHAPKYREARSEVLQSRSRNTNSNESEPKKDFVRLKKDLNRLKRDLNRLKRDLNRLKRDLNKLKWDLGRIKTDLITPRRTPAAPWHSKHELKTKKGNYIFT